MGAKVLEGRLLVHRDPWQLELYGPDSAGMRRLQTARVNQPGIHSAAVGLTFSLQRQGDKLELVVDHPDGRNWRI